MFDIFLFDNHPSICARASDVKLKIDTCAMTPRNGWTCVLVALCAVTLIRDGATFSVHPTRISSSTTRLSATKKKKSKKSPRSSSGFGGAAIEPCPCGSGEGYAKCCGKVHNDANAYKTATAEQVVRARYSAYAKRQVREMPANATHSLVTRDRLAHSLHFFFSLFVYPFDVRDRSISSLLRRIL